MQDRPQGKGVDGRTHVCLLSCHAQKGLRGQIHRVALCVAAGCGRIVRQKAAVQIDQPGFVAQFPLTEKHMLRLQIRMDDALQVQPLQAQSQTEQYLPFFLPGKGFDGAFARQPRLGDFL